MLYSAIRLGMDVVGADGKRIGRVRMVGSTLEAGVLVDRPGQRDLWIAPEAIQEVTATAVVLRVPADAVDEVAMTKPPMIGPETP